MRYATPIYLMDIKKGDYDPSTGDYMDDDVLETMRLASVQGCSKEAIRFMFGEGVEEALNIHTQIPIPQYIKRMRIGEKVYSIEKRSERLLTGKASYIVKEVP